ncbi:hypothetical protein WAI453_007718 [Rhynchosporium graminicola]|uniref:Related to acetylxylan esterase n=1 Tax=Rhynchosporium graminicola TaxID=2792576 RepID=A0A1E1L2J1_9HELO|nr:related to acetylxylan esterase precursor [Rhynchosporium commune]
MRPSTFLAISLASLTTALPTLDTRESSNTTSSNSAPCATGVHIIVARASTEVPGEGIIGAVADQVVKAVPGSDSEAVGYPATLLDYLTSEGTGVKVMTNMIETYTMRCPQSKLVLMGYSQGAQVVGDVMCGTSTPAFNSTPPIPIAMTKNIVAIIQMGDPSHIPNLPQDVGDSSKAGIFKRPNTNSTSCMAMEPITKNFCSADDRFCDSGTSTAVHLSYVREFGVQAREFVIQKAKAAIMESSNTGTPKPNGAREARDGPAVWMACAFSVLMMVI